MDNPDPTLARPWLESAYSPYGKWPHHLLTSLELLGVTG